MGRILIVAHELTRAMSLVAALKLKGYTTLIATESQEALALAEAHRPHLAIISDSLPPSDAIHETLRARYSSEELPIIVLEEALSTGKAWPLQSIMMPFVPHELLERIQALMQSRYRGISRSI
jgi:DNA-binding response OmpR family regulator